MKLYRIELINIYSERYIVTVSGSSFYEAMKKLELAPGWTVDSYSIVGASA